MYIYKLYISLNITLHVSVELLKRVVLTVIGNDAVLPGKVIDLYYCFI